jgi:hypothetical protein
MTPRLEGLKDASLPSDLLYGTHEPVKPIKGTEKRAGEKTSSDRRALK